ncbi:MAG: transposase [Nitrospiraceae bacterium]
MQRCVGMSSRSVRMPCGCRDFFARNVEAGSTVRTDGWPGYSDESLVGDTHRVRGVRTPERAHWVAPHVHRVFSNLNAWLNTHHGVEPQYLQRYVDEFIFRFNRRKTPTATFQTLLGIFTQKAPGLFMCSLAEVGKF